MHHTHTHTMYTPTPRTLCSLLTFSWPSASHLAWDPLQNYLALGCLEKTLEYQVIRRHFFMVYLLKDDNPRLVVNLAHLFQNVLSSPELFQTQWPAFLLAAVEPALLPKCLSSWFHLWHLPSLLPPSSRPPSAS